MLSKTWLYFVVCTFIVSSCAQAPDNEGRNEGTTTETIALFTKNQTNPYFQTIRLGAESAAKQMSASIVHYVPTRPDSIPDQMSQIEDAIVKRPNAVVFIPVDHKAMVPGVEKLNAANIPVINTTDRSAGGQTVTFVGCDDQTLALNTARYLFQKMNGKGSVVIIEGVGGSSNNDTRIAGYRMALAEFPNVKVLASQPANLERSRRWTRRIASRWSSA
jgi:ribose transport system substrate-binding protein